jgi:lipoprotein-anchoring transpeptidase ErfK/SrfK
VAPGSPDDQRAAYEAAQASIRRAEEELATMFGGGGAATPPPAASRHRTARPPTEERGSAAPDLPPPARRRGPLRRRLGGLAITLAFIPVGLVASAALVGDSDDGIAAIPRSTAAPERETTTQAFRPADVRAARSRHASVIARIPSRRVRAYVRPTRKAKHRTIRGEALGGKPLPLVMLVKQRRKGWLQVYLPTRPNLSKAWIRRGKARLAQTTYRVRVELSEHRIEVFRGAERIMRRPIGVGRSLTPTPLGQYYVTSLIRPPDPRGAYGPYAFGLSGHSPVLTTFAGGDGQLGLHGTDAPSALGSDVSHGCIRVRNAVIRELARTLPLGTPVAIRS